MLAAVRPRLQPAGSGELLAHGWLWRSGSCPRSSRLSACCFLLAEGWSQEKEVLCTGLWEAEVVAAVLLGQRRFLRSSCCRFNVLWVGLCVFWRLWGSWLAGGEAKKRHFSILCVFGCWNSGVILHDARTVRGGNNRDKEAPCGRFH